MYYLLVTAHVIERQSMLWLKEHSTSTRINGFEQAGRKRFNRNHLGPEDSTGFNNCWNLVPDPGAAKGL
jgi:hypothetical protein